MGIGAGILIAAVGAILAFAVTGELAGVDVQTVGLIVMFAGIAIALIALIATMSRRRTVVGDGVVGTRTTVVDAGPRDSAQI